MQNLNKSWPCGFPKMAYDELDELSLMHSKVGKIAHWWALFFPEHIIFQLEHFRGIMYHDTEGWYNI